MARYMTAKGPTSYATEGNICKRTIIRNENGHFISKVTRGTLSYLKGVINKKREGTLSYDSEKGRITVGHTALIRGEKRVILIPK